MCRRSVFSSTMLLVITLLWACEGSDPDSGNPRFDLGTSDARNATESGAPADASGPPLRSFNEFCTAYAAARCAGIFKCCVTATELFESQEFCQAAYVHVCEYLFDKEKHSPSCMPFAAQGAQEFVQSRITAAESCSAPEPLPKITEIFKGTRTQGGDCTYSSQDRDMSRCCAPNFYCDQEPWTGGVQIGTCLQRLAAGAQCGYHGQCVVDHYCPVDVEPAEDRTCTPRLSNGQPCGASSGGACLSSFCDVGGLCAENIPTEIFDYFCDLKVTLCWYKWITAPTEAACEWSWDCPDQIYSVKCAADQSNWACDCAVNGVVQKSITPINPCEGYKNNKIISEIGCGWVFPPEPRQ